MRKLILMAMVIGLLLSPALTQNVVADDPQMQVAQSLVLCCCQTDMGMCCAWVSFCSGTFVPGCFCK